VQPGVVARSSTARVKYLRARGTQGGQKKKKLVPPRSKVHELKDGLVVACPRRYSSVTKEPQEGSSRGSSNYEQGQERVPKLSAAACARTRPHLRHAVTLIAVGLASCSRRSASPRCAAGC